MSLGDRILDGPGMEGLSGFVGEKIGEEVKATLLELSLRDKSYCQPRRRNTSYNTEFLLTLFIPLSSSKMGC